MYAGALIADRYRLATLLGTGSMGHVWKARDERLQRDIAIKLVDLSQATEAVTPERFQREVIATARLNHPNIVTVFDAGTEANLAYLVMELLPGRSLAEVLRSGGALPVREAAHFGTQVARALEAAHGIGVVHRDIKPANIMINGPSATILDFGIAQLTTEASATLTSPFTALGTAAYMAPEQATAGRAGPESDVYSLGCVLTAMLTGRPPFGGGTSVEVASQQINSRPPRLAERRPDVPAELDDLVARMLSKDPGARPSASQVADALRAGFPGGSAGPASEATAVLPASTAVPPASTAVLAASTAGQPLGAPPPPSALRRGESSGVDGPGAYAPPPTGRDSWFGRGVRTIVVGVVAILLVGTAWALGSRAFNSLGGPAGAPTRTASRPTLPALPLPSIPAPTLPSARSAALRAAVAAVSASVDGLSGSPEHGAATKKDLRDRWAKAGDRILAGTNAAKEYQSFVAAVDKAKAKGRVTDTEYATLRLSLAAVGALV